MRLTGLAALTHTDSNLFAAFNVRQESAGVSKYRQPAVVVVVVVVRIYGMKGQNHVSNACSCRLVIFSSLVGFVGRPIGFRQRPPTGLPQESGASPSLVEPSQPAAHV